MSRITRCTIAYLVLCLAALLTLSTIGVADTLQLTGVSGTSAGGVYTGLYTLTDNGKPILAFCDDFDTHTFVGESWSATAYTLGDLVQLKFGGANNPGALSSNFLQDYQAVIYLGQMLSDTPKSNPQRINDLSFAIWGVFSADARANAAYDAASAAFDQTALSMTFGPNQYSNWLIRTPNPVDVSQEFITSPTPEPGALLLLGSSLIGLAFFVRRFKHGIMRH